MSYENDSSSGEETEIDCSRRNCWKSSKPNSLNHVSLDERNRSRNRENTPSKKTNRYPNRENTPSKKTNRYPNIIKNYDGIVFLVGHSAFGDIDSFCHKGTPNKMKVRTLLVGNTGTTCYMCLDPFYLEHHIKSLYTDSLDMIDEDIEETTHVFKQQNKTIGNHTKFDQTSVDRFYNIRGKFNDELCEYCERKWAFFNEKTKKREGIIMLLRKNTFGYPYFEKLYESDLNSKNFEITKTELLDDLNKKNIKNVLLIDYGCTEFSPDICPIMENQIKSGFFGGENTKRKKTKKKTKRKRRPNRTKRIA